MTHAECQDLLLDLAYGELSAGRASEVAAHLAGCEECRKEKAVLDQTRRATAPLREVEEPPPGFDDRILEAARTQASLEHDGNLGQVIEVSGKVSPLGLEAARIDAHANPKTRAEPARPRWVLRAAVGGSIAAAAALALLVSTSLQSRRQEAPSNPDEFKIRVQPAAPQAVDTALREAEAKRETQAAPPAARQPVPPDARVPAMVHELTAPPVPQEGERNAAPPARKMARSEKSAQPAAEGSGGDAADSYLPAKNTSPAPAAARPAPAAGVVSSLPAAKAEVQAPADLEASAQRARHAGNYPLAAGLYRKAAALRRDAGNDPSTAAWDLAHAVECLAAGGLFEEARQVGQDLAKLHPSEVDARAAARRALREVDVPAADR